ncbi:MAG: DUF6807 family protein [Planctomycetota bacterium]
MDTIPRHGPLLVGMLALLSWIPVAAQEGAGVVPEKSALSARTDPQGQVVLAEGGRPVLKYQARRVELPAGYFEQVAEGNRIYARPRSGYVHPLYGLDGEELTLDWSVDHPHHRGIYWAWPEVRFGEKAGDLHALQNVYSRPVGEPALTDADGFARIEAKNLWLFEDETPVVFERVAITAHAPSEQGSRVIDLDLRFEALVEGVSLARRGTNQYGGLNVRLAPVEGLVFGHHTESDPSPLAWSSATGTWKGGRRVTTLAILEHPSNPEFPGDFITYEYLPWFQPTFPRPETRFLLKPGRPLDLRYRFLILPGEADAELLAAACDRYGETETALSRTNADETK